MNCIQFLLVVYLLFYWQVTYFPEKVNVNDATIVESEVFVYNLGTMFYINKVLFTTVNSLPPTSTEPIESTAMTSQNAFTTIAESESIPEEMAEDTGSLPDVLFADGAATDTPPETTTNQNSTIK